MAFDMPARQAFTVEMTSRKDLMNAISLNSSIFNGARIVGPSVAGFLMAQAGMTSRFLLNGLSFIAVIAGLLMMRLPGFVPPAESQSTGRHVLEGLAYVAGHRRVRLLLLFVGVVGVFGWSYSVLLPAYAAEVSRVAERGYGALLSANGVGALLGALTVAAYGGSGPAPADGAWRGVAVLGHAVVTCLRAMVFARAGAPGRGRFGNAAPLLDHQHACSDQCVRCYAGAARWASGPVVWRPDRPGDSNRAGPSQAVGVPWTIALGAPACASAGLVLWLVVRADCRLGRV